LLEKFELLDHQNYGYRFILGPTQPPAQLYSFGWQKKETHDYYFHGLQRNEENGNCIFQYTLSGTGTFEMNGQKYSLKKGMAFISHIPSNHCYYLPEESSEWEFIYITLTGYYAISEWNTMQEQYGNILTLTDQDEVIQFFWNMYSSAQERGFSDGFETSAIAYEFIMTLWKRLISQAQENQPVHHGILTAIDYMKDNYQKAITLDDLASSVSMSRFHFNRKFSKAVGVSPWKYLTKLRIESAADFLLTTNLTNENISMLCGYDNSNYFDKVFRKYVGMSPGKFRQTYKGIDNFRLRL